MVSEMNTKKCATKSGRVYEGDRIGIEDWGTRE
jgi:hypothetical protein